MFMIGDLVAHPMHGAGVIDAIVQEKVAGKTEEYYVFKMPVGGLLLKIPVANSASVGLRAIITPEEAESLIAGMASLEVENSANWNKRYQENLQRLKSGDLREVSRVVKGLMTRDARRGLSTGERKMLQAAKRILISEIVLTEQTDYEAVESRINCAMTQGAAV